MNAHGPNENTPASKSVNGFGPNPNPPGNPELLNELNELRDGDPTIGGNQSLARFTVDISRDFGLASVSTEWSGSPNPDRRAWLATFAGIVCSVRFAAFFEAREANSAVVAVAHQSVQLDREYRSTDVEFPSEDGVPFADLRLEVELQRGLPSGIENGFIKLTVPDGMNPRFATDAALVLREHLCGQSIGTIPGVARAGYNVIADAAYEGFFDAASLSDQLTAPLLAMRVLEREGLVWPYLGDEPIMGMDCKDVDTSRWDEISVGMGR